MTSVFGSVAYSRDERREWRAMSREDRCLWWVGGYEEGMRSLAEV
jgi:hypothetical protein